MPRPDADSTARPVRRSLPRVSLKPAVLGGPARLLACDRRGRLVLGTLFVEAEQTRLFNVDAGEDGSGLRDFFRLELRAVSAGTRRFAEDPSDLRVLGVYDEEDDDEPTFYDEDEDEDDEEIDEDYDDFDDEDEDEDDYEEDDDYEDDDELEDD